MADESALGAYVVGDGGRLPGGKAGVQVVAGELDLINREEGQISAESVVARARQEGTALNAWDRATHYFEWDDSVAAERHREEQARLLIRTVTVETVIGDQRLRTRAFVSLKDGPNSKVYRPVGYAASNPDAHREIITRFQNEILRIDSAYRAYLAYADFAVKYGKVFDAVDHVIDMLAAEGEPRAKQRQAERYRRRGSHVALEGE